jgi:hypothetical protein
MIKKVEEFMRKLFPEKIDFQIFTSPQKHLSEGEKMKRGI